MMPSQTGGNAGAEAESGLLQVAGGAAGVVSDAGARSGAAERWPWNDRGGGRVHRADSRPANSASYTQPVGGGLYSAYVGTIVDAVHLVALMRTAQYQYIPGLAFPDGSTLNLKLNAPPSFHNPKSVIVIALPAVQPAKLPPLKPHNADEVSCLKNPKMVLEIEGAPLVFSTSLAHDMVLHLNRTGAPVDVPLQADADQGGLVVAPDKERKPLDDAMAKVNDAVK